MANGLLTVYNSADLATIDLPMMISKSRPSTFPRPQLVKTLNLSQASETLGVDPNAIVRLIENDFLTPSSPRRHKSNEMRFHVHLRLIEFCSQKGIPYSSLISSRIATKILGVGLHQLRLLVKWGTLKPIYAQAKRYSYFIRDAVEALAKSDEFQSALTTKSDRIRLDRKVLERS